MRITERTKFRMFNISTLITGFMLFIMGFVALKYSPEGIAGLIFAVCGIALGILLLILSQYYHVKARRLGTAHGDRIGSPTALIRPGAAGSNIVYISENHLLSDVILCR